MQFTTTSKDSISPTESVFDTILTKASAHLDLFTKINKVEEAIESHKEWLNSITRDLEATGLSKQLRKLEKVNKVKDGPDR